MLKKLAALAVTIPVIIIAGTYLIKETIFYLDDRQSTNQVDATDLNATNVEPEVQEEPSIAENTLNELLVLVNAERAKVGSKPLIIDQRLNSSAKTKADEMESVKAFGHENPITGKHGYEYAKEAMPQCVYWSENLVNIDSGQGAQAAMYKWMASTPHRTALLDPRYEYVGFGSRKTMIVQHFCDLI